MRATPKDRLGALKMRDDSTLDNQQQLGDGDLNKIMDLELYKATETEDASTFMDAIEAISQSSKLPLSLIFNQVTPSGNSLLHVAASCEKEDVVGLILSHFSDLVTQKNSTDDTPLHVAVRDGRFNATEKLIHLGTHSKIIYWKNKDGKSPLYLAVEKCKFSERPWEPVREILQLLLQESAQDGAYAVNIQGKSPVFAAIMTPGKVILEEVIDKLPKLLHARDENGGTPLHFAASIGNVEKVQFLISECVYLALQTDKNGSYPIHIACESGHIDTICELVKMWPNLEEIRNKNGQNILHVAAKAGNNRVVQHILNKCGEPVIIEKLVNSKDVCGNTPLHLASKHNHCQVLLSLTRYQKIDLKLLNNDKLTALDVALESGSWSTKNPASLGRAILIIAGVPQSEGRDILSSREQSSEASKSSRAEWIKDQVNTRLLVATLVASVTFTAGFTLPGGYNDSVDPFPGSATMLHNRVFRVFIISNMLAMYSSILAVVVLFWGHVTDLYIAEIAYLSAGPLLLMALTGMTVAFMAAVTVAVRELTWLASLVLCTAVFFLGLLIMVLVALIFPFSKIAMRIVSLYYKGAALPEYAVTRLTFASRNPYFKDLIEFIDKKEEEIRVMRARRSDVPREERDV